MDGVNTVLFHFLDQPKELVSEESRMAFQCKEIALASRHFRLEVGW